LWEDRRTPEPGPGSKPEARLGAESVNDDVFKLLKV
jgi:hypothetical protein